MLVKKTMSLIVGENVNFVILYKKIGGKEIS